MRTIRAELDQHIQSLGNGRREEISVCHRGYHVYKEMWDWSYQGNSFTTKHEQNNQHDHNVLALAITHTFTWHMHERSYYLSGV